LLTNRKYVAFFRTDTYPLFDCFSFLLIVNKDGRLEFFGISFFSYQEPASSSVLTVSSQEAFWKKEE
jgi:hypothetical protein